jgi:hypothetical protein
MSRRPESRRKAELAERADAVEKIRRGLADVKTGRTKPAAKVFAELRRKFKIPRSP